MKALAGALAAVLVSTAPILAQEPVGRPRGALPSGAGVGFPPGIDVLGVAPLEWLEPVVGAPFSADTVTELTQQLSDGNRIELRTTGSVARDRRGRIRREQTLTGLGAATADDGVRIVTITDPAARELFRLDEARKIAWRLRLPSPRVEKPGGSRPAPPPQSLRTEQLEPTQFDGVTAEGTRARLVLPAGAIGNTRPIEEVSERWYAPDLQIVVSTRRVDPRFGDVKFRLENIRRTDPPPELFEIPPDFNIREQQPFPPPPDLK